MKTNATHVGLVGWIARIITMLFAAFISIFAMDVFGEGYGFPKVLLALFMHLIPTFLIIIVLIFSWNREWIGGIVFSALGVFYIIWGWGRFHWIAYALIAGPLFLVSILFFIGWNQRKRVIS